MTFTVTYRGSDGAVREERVEAAGRGDCFAQCRARGIAPMSVKEGWSGRGKAPNPRKSHVSKIGAAPSTVAGVRPSAAKGGAGAKSRAIVRKVLVMCLALVAVGGGVWWWLSTRPQSVPSPGPEVPKKTALPKEAAPKVVPTPKPEAAPSPETKTVDRPAEKEPELLTNIKKNVHGRRTPRPVKVVVPGRLGADGKPVEVPPPLFKTMGDNHLEQLVNYQPGERFLAIVEPAQIARDFMEHMNDPIEILPEDTPAQAERKRNYIEVRKAIIEELRRGADLEEMIIEARRTLDKIANMRDQYAKALEEEQAAGTSDDDLDDLASAASMLLKEHGANPILSPRQQEAEMQRREEETARAMEEKDSNDSKGETK